MMCRAPIAWQRRFGGRLDVLEKRIDVEGAAVEVIGVMPEGFAFPTTRADLSTPMRLDPAQAGHRQEEAAAIGESRGGCGAGPALGRLELSSCW